MTEHVAILAYGSLIWDPGDEIRQHTIAVVDGVTPFNIEYAYFSQYRKGAPTLTKVEGFGSPTNAKLLVLDLHDTAGGRIAAYEVLYKRETRLAEVPKDRRWDGYGPLPESFFMTQMHNYCVLYAAFQPSTTRAPTSTELAEKAKKSVINCKHEREKNGVRYLINCYNSGVITPLTETYLDALGGRDADEIEQRILNETKH